ncbi:MAG: NAD(P)/FAD-dependent oxidoreductase [Nitrospirota bacterium]|nr:NAD(P)/FAD-dependent oxidoreductase [Nitrospirota bacterium]
MDHGKSATGVGLADPETAAVRPATVAAALGGPPPSEAPPGVHRVVVVGGGAGGLELATRLGNSLGRKGRAHITLVDSRLTHLWKPLLHEVAAGTLDSSDDDIQFLAQAMHHHFTFRLGTMDGVDRERKVVHLSPILDAGGAPLSGPREIAYDTLVLAIGSVSNDFGVAGVREHCHFLDTREQADRFQQALLNGYLRAQHQEHTRADGITVAIVGGGATGVELAAELHHVTRRLVAYGFDRIDPDRDVRLVLVEAGPRLLPAAPERLSRLAERELTSLGVVVQTGVTVTQVTARGLETGDVCIPADLRVWAAGIRAPRVTTAMGLEVNRIGQLVVGETLQTTRDPDIFALGDSAACAWPATGRNVPPTAQAAHQQAAMLASSLERRLNGRPLRRFRYHDHGLMVSLSHYTAVGNLMGNLLRLSGAVMIEGWLARLAYRLLYRKHQAALFGLPRTTLMMLSDWLSRRGRARLKLH